MKRFRNLLNYAMNCIQRYKLRTLVILICLSIAAAAFSSMAFLSEGLAKEGALSLKYAPDLTVQGIEAGRQSLVSTSLVSRVASVPGVSTVNERIWGYGNVGNTLVVVVGVNGRSLTTTSQTNQSANDLSSAYPIEVGKFLDPLSSNEVVVGKGIANLLGANVGTVLSILSESNRIKSYNIVGIFNSESGIYNSDMILMSFDAARDFFSIPEDKVTDVMVYVPQVDPATKTSLVNSVARQISELANCRVLTKDVLLDAQEKTYGDRSGFFSVVWYIVLIAVAIIAFNQTVVVGHESKFEIGLLKSLGFSTSDVIQVRLIESLTLGALAGVIGLSFGIIFDSFLGAPVLRDFMLGWANLYPSFPVPVYISLQTVMFTFAITIVPLLFATVIPSWLNATVDPDIAMRGARA